MSVRSPVTQPSRIRNRNNRLRVTHRPLADRDSSQWVAGGTIAGFHLALARCVVSERFRTPCGRLSYFSLNGQRKVAKREATPMARPPGILPSGCAGGLRGFPTAHPCAGGKLARLRAGHPADYPPPTRRAIGAPQGQACVRAPKAEQPRTTSCGRGDALASSGAHDARRSSWGPSAAVRRGRKSPQGRGQGWPRLFVRAGARSKSPAPPHALFAHGWAKSAAAGCRFLLATSLLGKQKRSSSRARRAHETALMPHPPHQRRQLHPLARLQAEACNPARERIACAAGAHP